jgi:putative two-component system response regulator
MLNQQSLNIETVSARVLIVDDEPSVRAVLRRALSTGEYEIVEASTGDEALELIARDGADVVLSDLLMPRMTGMELLARAKVLDDALGFIMLTGVGTMENAIDALRRHADDYLLKPFNIDEVRISVSRALRHRRLVLENRNYQRTLEDRVQEQARKIENLLFEGLLIVSSAVEARDGYTGEHVGRVTRYALATGERLGLDRESLRSLWMGSILHDVGKIGIPDSILKKPGPLTAEEAEVMKRHPLISAAIVERSSFLKPALPGILHHHEKWDGTGYPYGLKGEEIPHEGRIIAVADAFDAITTDRPYRAGRSFDAAVHELRACVGTHFDGAVVDAFIRALEEGFADIDLGDFPVDAIFQQARISRGP